MLQTYGHFIKLVHFCAGVYIWEFITTLGFEWEVYTGKRPYRWPFIVYVTARVLALICVIISLAVFNVTGLLNCNAWLGFVLSTAWFSAASASFLLVLRGISLWGWDFRIVVLTGSFFLANLVGSLYSLKKVDVGSSPGLQTCLPSQTGQFRWSIMINFIEDSVLLAVMLFGVLRRRNATPLWELLCLQSLFWTLAVVLTELPSVVLVFRNINDGWNMMFQYPHFTLMVIASSRAYRHLSQYTTDHCLNAMPRDEHRSRSRSQVNQVMPQSGRNVQVTVSKTVEYDIESRQWTGENLPSLPSMAGVPVEAKGDFKHRELTEEEEHIQTLEYQMKQDLDI